MHDVLTPSKADDVLSPSPSHPEKLPDLLRSNSYSLSRGGKVISSRPWSFHDAKGIDQVMKRTSSLRDADETTTSSSSSSESSSTSSGDEVALDKGDATEKLEDSQRKEVDDGDEDDDDEDDEDDDDDSKETETTVIARRPPCGTPDQNIDEGDTLSSFSGGDLSFERDEEPTSVKDKESIKEVQSPPNPITDPINHTKYSSVENENSLSFSQPVQSEEDPQLSQSFEFYPEVRHHQSTSSPSSHLPSATDTESGVSFKTKLPSCEKEAVFCFSGFPSPYNHRERSGIERTETLDSVVTEESNKKKVKGISTSSLLPRFVGTTTTTVSPSYPPRVRGRPPPVPHHPKSPHFAKKYQLRLTEAKQHSWSYATSDGSSENGRDLDHERQSVGRSRPLKTPPNAIQVSSSPWNGKLVLNNTLPDTHPQGNACYDSCPSKKESSRRSPSASSRRSAQNDGLLSQHECSMRGPCDRVCNRGCSPTHSEHSMKRYSFGPAPTAVSSCGCEEQSQVMCQREDSEELSDVSSGASTSEDSNRPSLRVSEKRPKGEGRSFASSMLTGLSDGHMTRLATPPDSSCFTPRFAVECDGGTYEAEKVMPRHHHHRPHHRPRPRPPPVPRPRTMEGSEVIPRHPRTYSPSLHYMRDSSVERSGRNSSCERAATASNSTNARCHHVSSHLHCAPHREVARPCWCEEERDYDSCDERPYTNRHSYHEGVHQAHPHTLDPGCSHPHPRDKRCHAANRMRRSVSPFRCQPCFPMGPTLSPLNDVYAQEALTIPYLGNKVGQEAAVNLSQSDYIPLWSCHSILNAEERLSHLEDDKSSLQLQVSVLSEQVEAQSEKINDLESFLEQKKSQLLKAEEQLQKEIMTRSTLETQRLELLSEISNMKLRQAASERENLDLKDKIRLFEIPFEHARSQNFSPPATSTPLNSFHNHESPSDYRQTPPPSARRKIDQFGTIPRHQRDLVMSHVTSPGAGHVTSTTGRPHKGVMFGKGFNTAFVALKVSGKRSTSAPNLAETEKLCSNNGSDSLPQGVSPDLKTEQRKGTASVSPFSTQRSPSVGHKPTGIKKIFTRLRRSSSGHIENDSPDAIDLKRGGIRATATARLGWTPQMGVFKEPQIPFASWSSRLIEEWMENLGLGQYCTAARCWMEGGNHLANATPHQLEKDVGVRHPLHKKKLQLAISNRLSQNNTISKSCANLDGGWVLRWLDDLGLPQYKDAFNESRVDGIVLNYITYDDLAFLKISNLLHVTSLKRGIQVLRQHNFDPTILKRRSIPEEDNHHPKPGEVALWTNHRVMEWLKTVDLSEYAPNLRGSGVHGALMVYEIRFTSEFLASLLSISSSKTLLRRHLSTHFKELVGKEVVQAKRELEVSPGYIPLTTTAKIKMPRKSQFSLKRKKTKSDLEFDDLLCPLDELLPRIPRSSQANKENPIDVN